MNKNNAAAYLPLVQALADGKLQYEGQGGSWHDYTGENCSFLLPPENYRVKPAPREGWIVVSGPEDLMSEETAKYIAGTRYQAIRVREVIE